MDINQIEIGDIVREAHLDAGRLGVVVSCLKGDRIRVVFYTMRINSNTYQETRLISQVNLVERGRDRCRQLDKNGEKKHAASKEKSLQHQTTRAFLDV